MLQGAFDEMFELLLPELLEEFGQSAILRRVHAKVYDPETDTETTPTPASTDYPVHMAPEQDYDERLIDGTHIQRGDVMVRVLGVGLPVRPDPKTDLLVKVEIAETGEVTELESFRVISVARQSTGYQTPVYNVQARR